MSDTFTLNILLSEVNEDDIFLFREALEGIKMPAFLSVVNDGNELMEKLYQDDCLPDVIFTDINMPLKNGLECLMEIRHNTRLKDIPVVILSTSIQKQTVEITYELGANLYLVKPTSVRNLRNLIKEALRCMDIKRPSVKHFFVKLTD